MSVDKKTKRKKTKRNKIYASNAYGISSLLKKSKITEILTTSGFELGFSVKY